MKRISKEIKAIADRHIAAVTDRTGFTELSPEEFAQLNQDPKSIKELLLKGHTLQSVVNVIERRYIPIGSSVMAHLMYASGTYRQGMYKGFRALFS